MLWLAQEVSVARFSFKGKSMIYWPMQGLLRWFAGYIIRQVINGSRDVGVPTERVA